MKKMKTMMNKKEIPPFIEKVLNDYLNIFVNTNTYDLFENEINAICMKIIKNRKLKNYEITKKYLSAGNKSLAGYIIKIEKKSN